MKKTRTKYLRLVAILLAGLIVALDVALLITPDRSYSQTENRNLQTFPELSWQGVSSGRFEARFEDYVEDQFPLRDLWIGLKTGVDRLMGRTESGGIFLAKDGYLIRNFPDVDPETYDRTIQAVRAFSAANSGIRQYMMVVPSALTVYENKLPANAIVGDESGYIDSLRSDLADCPIEFIDLRDELLGQRGEKQLYYRTDHHWTTAAAELAYRKFAAQAGLPGAGKVYQPTLISDSFSGTLTASSGFRLSQTDPVYVYLPEKSMNYVVSYPATGEKHASVYWTKNLGVRDHYTVFFNGNHPEVHIDTSADNKRVLMILKDSYANCFVPFMVEDYKKIVMVDPRYFTDDLTALMAAEGVNEILFLYNAATLATDTALYQDLTA